LPRVALLSSAELVPEPLGFVLIISSWNFPFGKLFVPEPLGFVLIISSWNFPFGKLFVT